MEYITSGDRIAVENFEIGSLYKVTFLNETEVYFMCCGIGKDFVMLMSNEPRLFSLTMLSAAEVDAIDEYTPLPPPTPPTNLLQYQTGEPPFTFTTTDTELFSWYIKGPAGDKTANLFDKNTALLGYEIAETIIVENESWAVSDYIPVKGNTHYIGGAFGNAVLEYETKSGSPVRITSKRVTGGFTTESTTQYIRINLPITNLNYAMFNEGETVKTYEPYGYKIPILCNTTLSNIYINEALGENDILYSTDTIYTIATELGDNLLQVQGETQPSLMQIVYKWEFEG